LWDYTKAPWFDFVFQIFESISNDNLYQNAGMSLRICDKKQKVSAVYPVKPLYR
jgi:hypothetical protein